MSTIKSSTEHLTLNADGAGKDIKFQANGVEVASIDSTGALTVAGLTSTGIDDNATSTAITIDASENVGIGTTTPSTGLSVVTGSANGIELGQDSDLSTDSGRLFFSTSAGSNSIVSHSGALGFNTGATAGSSSGTERMRINANGYIESKIHGGVPNIKCTNTDTGLDNDILQLVPTRTASSAYNFLMGRSGDDDTQVVLRGDGNSFCDGSWSGGGADYAEYFEWSDGNTSDEDRRGVSVVLEGNKIRPATEGESPIGVISGNPSVVGDSAWNKWDGKYLTDDFGTYTFESYTVTEWEVQDTNEDGLESTKIKSFESDRIPAGETVPSDAVVSTTDDAGNIFKRRTLNPDWNPDTEYVSREDRKEWDTVGLMGKLRVLKGQPVASRWIKMRDVSDTVEEWLVR